MALKAFSSQTVERKLTFPEVLRLPGVEERLELRSDFGFMAFHGGNLERRTEQIAADAAEQSGSSLYTVVQPWGTRHHFPSATVTAEHSDSLARFLDHCEVVVAIHGFGRHGHWDDLLCGGQNRGLAEHMGQGLRDALPERYNVVTELDEIPKKLRGVHPDNPVNRVRGGGMQLELPPGVRGLTPGALKYPTPFPHLVSLIEGLATAATTWNAPSPNS